MGAPEAFTQTTDVAHWISGATQRGSGTRSQTVWNPTTGAPARQVLLASEADVNTAVAAAVLRSRPGATCRRFAARAS